jgi:hypothetical protein
MWTMLIMIARENDISENEELSEYDETDDDGGNFYIGRDKQKRWRKTNCYKS